MTKPVEIRIILDNSENSQNQSEIIKVITADSAKFSPISDMGYSNNSTIKKSSIVLPVSMINRRVEPAESISAFLNPTSKVNQRRILSGSIPIFNSNRNSNNSTRHGNPRSDMIIERDESLDLGNTHLTDIKIQLAKENNMQIEKTPYSCEDSGFPGFGKSGLGGEVYTN